MRRKISEPGTELSNARWRKLTPAAPLPNFPTVSALQESLIELIRRTSAEIPEDVQQAIMRSLEQEKKGTIAQSAMKIIERNIELAKQKSQPICQDTGSILFYVNCPVGFDQIAFEETAREAVKAATRKGYLRQNSVDSLTGKNDGTNVGPGSPTIHFHQHRSPEVFRVCRLACDLVFDESCPDGMSCQDVLPMLAAGTGTCAFSD
jgi:fumarate hydratase class I